MKELSIEEKAKLYDEAKARMNRAYNSNRCTIGFMNEIFPRLKVSEDEKIKQDIIWCLKHSGIKDNKTINPNVTTTIKDAIAWLEKQGEKEQLYIRFGKIPTDEKSKIYQGEIEVGIENGVSVYPAFKTDKGNIVLGLNLPITKTTLYTQQHLIEYDNRPCYLVKGDYVGKDTDGQPLINNVSIIEKIDNYRVKEKKQGEQKPTDKVKPMFHEGDWVIIRTNATIMQIVNNKDFYESVEISGQKRTDTYNYVEWYFRPWTIQDAKDGDILVDKYNNICIFKQDTGIFWHSYICLGCDGELRDFNICGMHEHTYTCPATKEQRDTLLKAMANAGWQFDFEKKELKCI